MYVGEKPATYLDNITTTPSNYREDQDMKWISPNGNGHKVTMSGGDYKAF